MTNRMLGTMTEDYLKVIWKAHEWSDEGITTNEIAATLGVAASSVSGNLSKLSREGYLDYEPYGRIRLSEQGRQIAVKMVRRHRIIETYLVERHGYPWDEVHDEAEVLEHAISDRLVELWDNELGNPAQDPHGDPIPRADGTIVRPDGRRLYELGDGDEGVVVRVSDHDAALLRYLDALGITVGTAVRVEARREYAGTVAVTRLSVAGATSATLELAAVAANAIWVSEIARLAE
jgi:DtxR family Mn-dependent transcriptional regulator